MQPNEEYRHTHPHVPVERDGHDELPVPSAWRPTLVAIVDAFVRGDYRLAGGVPGVAPVDDETAQQIGDAIADYGATLVALPPATWSTSVCMRMEDHWSLLVDLWTEEEGCSDLVLEVRVTEDGGGYLVTVYMVYVP